ncbi:MAG: sigma-70 family RNA polymerase sigma factor [Bacteroidota bacterium]
MDFPHLIKRSLKKDQKAQKALFEGTKEMIMGICLRYSRREEDAKDIFQEAFIKIFLELHKLKSPKAFISWAQSITVRVALNFYQKKSQRVHQPLDDISLTEHEGFISDNHIEAYLDTEILLGYLQQLPDNQRMVFNLFAIEGYSHKEIAQLLGIEASSSRVYLAKARKSLQKKIISFHQSIKKTHET